MIILAGTVRLPPENLKKAQAAFEAMIAATRAEPGCIAYAFAHDVMEAGLIRIFEIFADQAALAAHRASPHMAQWRAAWPALGIGERNMTHYDVASFQKI